MLKFNVFTRLNILNRWLDFKVLTQLPQLSQKQLIIIFSTLSPSLDFEILLNPCGGVYSIFLYLFLLDLFENVYSCPKVRYAGLIEFVSGRPFIIIIQVALLLESNFKFIYRFTHKDATSTTTVELLSSLILTN